MMTYRSHSTLLSNASIACCPAHGNKAAVTKSRYISAGFELWVVQPTRNLPFLTRCQCIYQSAAIPTGQDGWSC